MALSEICDAKAEHIRENWQDHTTARTWAQACGLVGIAAASVNHKLHV